MALIIRPLTPDLWPALEDLFGQNGACNGCWCMYGRIGSAYRKRPREENKADFREVVEEGAAARPARLRWRPGRGLVPAHAARGGAVARSRLAAEARGRRAGLVALLLLRA